MSGNIVIIGCGGHATSVAETVISAGYDIDCFVDETRAGETHLGCLVKASLEAVTGDLNLVIGLGDNAMRERVASDLRERFPNAAFPAIIHESASVSSFATIGTGAVVMQNASVGSNAVVDEFCIINTNASIDHDSRIAKFASIAPGVVAGGNFELGQGAAVGIGAVVKHGIKIAENTLIGANSYVNRDIPANSVYFGTPASFRGNRQKGDEYL